MAYFTSLSFLFIALILGGCNAPAGTRTHYEMPYYDSAVYSPTYKARPSYDYSYYRDYDAHP